MKTIKVFIASSEELKMERLEFTDMIQQLNRIFKPRNLEIELVKWEYLDASMGPLHKQEEYNNELKTCEMCLVLYWTRFGDYTKSELETAYSELCAGHNPQKLYVYFKDAEDITPELKAFKDSFDTLYGHFYCRFENVDTMKLNFLLQFEGYQNKTTEGLLKVQDSRVEVDGKPFVELKNIPFAGNNPEYLQLLKQIDITQTRVLKYPNEIEFRQELHDLQERRKLMENSLLDTAKLITQLSSSVSSARFSEAMRLFESGDNKGANAILNFDEITHDARSNAARIDAAREIELESIKALESNIEELQLKIKTLQNAMEKGWFNEVIAVYGETISLAKNRISPEKIVELLINYANFLLDNMQYHLIGTLYDDALSISRKLAITNPDIYENEVARTLYNLARLHSETQRYDLAEKEYTEPLEISRRLAAQNPDALKSDLASVLNNLASLHSETQRYDLAEKEYTESLEISRRLAAQNPDAYESDVAITLNNLSVLHRKTHCLDVAIEECSESLELFRRRSIHNPAVYGYHLANSLNNLATLHSDIQRYDLAERELSEVLEIYRRLSSQNPDVFKSDLASVLNNLASLHSETQRYDLAEKEYIQSLDIFRGLSVQNPDVFEPYLAEVLRNLAILHSDTQRLNLAIKEYNESLDIYRRLSAHNKGNYKKYVNEKLVRELARVKAKRLKEQLKSVGVYMVLVTLVAIIVYLLFN